MRRPFLIALIVAFLGFSAYIGHGAIKACPVPIDYRIGSLDERFNLSEGEVLAILAEAEGLWERATGRELFQYSESGDFPINFIFDDRQERTIAEQALRDSLNEKENTTDSIAEQYDTLVAKYGELEEAYETDVVAYEKRVAAYNKEVAKHNESGGAPPKEFAALEAKEAALEKESKALATRAEELEKLATSINTLSERGNRIIEQYNTGISTYNSRFGQANEFTQGDYQGDHINVYSFGEQEELLLVLIHEFGHALSLGHVEGEESIMYYLLEDQSSPPSLTSEDIAAFSTVCGKDPGVVGWTQRVYNQLNQFYNHLTNKS